MNSQFKIAAGGYCIEHWLELRSKLPYVHYTSTHSEPGMLVQTDDSSTWETGEKTAL